MQFLRPAKSINDPRFTQSLSRFDMGQALIRLNEPLNTEDYENIFCSWVGKSQRVSWSLPKAMKATVINGSTDAFTNFYLTHPKRRLVLLKGEYPFHRDCFDSLDRRWSWYEDTTLTSQDFLVLSLPFSGNGNPHMLQEQILQKCEEKNIPVLLDLAFLGLGAQIDLTSIAKYRCIETITYSFSKQFNLGKFRIGLQWSKQPQGPLTILKEWNYHNWFATLITQHLMQEFEFDFIHNNYRTKQQEICAKHGVAASESVIFALDSEKHPEFSRDGFINRLCLSSILSASLSPRAST